MKRLTAVLVLLALLGVPSFAAAQSGATILLVRHAEKVSNAPDAGLSDLGKERAERLARVLADAGISAIYTSEVQRTQQTVAPLAKRLKIEPTVIAAKDMDGLVKRLQAVPDGAVVLVVGHSNTLPIIIEKFLGKQQAGFHGGTMREMTMGDADYDRLFIISSWRELSVSPAPPNTGIAKLLILHY